MNAVMSIETQKDAARRLAASAIREGYKPTALYEYFNADGSLFCCRIRCDRADGKKWIRPMHLDGAVYVPGEPPAAPNGKPLYRLTELIASANNAPVFVVEGEKCANALAKLDVLATTSGSADSAGAADWTPLSHRACVIWPDHDKAGAKYAHAVGERLRALGCAVETIAADALNLPEKGDCVDWLAANPDATAATIAALPRAKTVRFEPEPLRRAVPPAEPYPIAELGPILGNACASLRRVIQAPDAVCGASILAAASLAVQGLVDVEIHGRRYPTTIWFLTVAESGERKSAVDAEALRAAREYEKAQIKRYSVECGAHAIDLDAWNARREAAKATARKANGEGLAAALKDIGAEPLQPLRPTLIVADFTAEGLAKLLAAGLPSVGAFTDEAALVFGGHGMTKETTARTAGTLCKLWDSGTLDRIRASDGASKLYGRRLALHLMAQPVIAERALSDDVLSGQGFLARTLLSWPESTAGSRLYSAESLRADAPMIRYVERLTKLHERTLVLAEGTRNELNPPALHLDDDALVAWRRVHDVVEAAMAPNGRYATVRPWASKTPEQILRIAGVLTLTEKDEAKTIDAATIERAAELALWHLNEAVRLASTAALSVDVRDAQALLDWTHATGRGTLHSRDALQFGPARIRERDRFLMAMDTLESAGWAEKIEGGAMLDGVHRRHVWRITSKQGA